MRGRDVHAHDLAFSGEGALPILVSQRFVTVLVSLFAGLALPLALAGVYGVQAYTVARQAPDMGVRMALFLFWVA